MAPSFKMLFGKYKGKTIKYIATKDPKYFEWLQSINPTGPVGDAIEDYLYDLGVKEEKFIDQCLKKIDKLVKSGEKVRYVNVHNVGEEYRLGTYTDGVWIENIMGEQFSVNGTKILKGNYPRLQEPLNKFWKIQGEITETRGLY